MTSKDVRLACLAAAFAFAQPALCASFGNETAFNQNAFEAAQKAGKPILVHITAGWCTTCTAQKPVLDKLRHEAPFASYVVFDVDFDGQKALVHRFHASMQSTLIVFKGVTEKGRSAGATQPAAIRSLLEKAV